MYKLMALAALVASATAFVVAPGAAVATRTTTSLQAYIPDGLTAEEWEAQKAEAAKAASDRKSKFAAQTFEDLDTWMRKRDKAFPGQPGAGHRMAKVVDAEKAKPRASSFLGLN